jgi:hypothetical protein
VWLIQHRTSDEARLRAAARPQTEIQQTAASVTFGVKPPSLTGRGAQQPGGRPQPADDPQRRLQQLGGWAAQLAGARPGLAAAPSIRFPLAAAERVANGERAARTYEALLRTRPPDAWSECAAAELGLLRGEGPTGRPLHACRRAVHPPRLDGRLEDELWSGADAVELKSAWRDDTGWPTTVRLAYDDRFLYVAATCLRAPGAAYAEAPGVRPRDANLAAHDRLDLCLDQDRDRATWQQWSIDSRGWTSESCWGDRSWNPTWYVARELDEARWCVEAAIAWTDVCGAAPTPGTTWSLGLQRIVPGVGFQSWTKPAAVDIVPQGFGLVRFE